MIAEKSLHSEDLPPKGPDSVTWMRENPGAAIALLCGIHVLAGIVLAFCSADVPTVSSALFISLVFCQTSLLGMWCGLGRSRWILRLIGLSVGTGYLAIVFGAGIDELSEETVFVVVVAVLLVAAVTWIVRWLKGAMQQIHDSAPDAREGLQFTIRHLLVLTFAVACLMGIGKALAPRISGMDQIRTVGKISGGVSPWRKLPACVSGLASWKLTPLILPTALSMMSVIAVCFVCVALAAIWAMLGLGHVALRSILLFVIAMIMGWILAHVIERSFHFFWIATTTLQATYLMASLFVIRSCGYRFLARQRSD